MTCKNRSSEQRLASSISKLGDKNPMKRDDVAKKVSVSIQTQYGKLISSALKQRWIDGKMPKPKPPTKETRLNISKRMIDNNPMKLRVTRNKVSEKMCILYSNPEFKMRVLSSQKVYPNKLELKLFGLLVSWNITQFKFTGDRTFWIGPCKSGLYRNPDFVDTENKKIILVCGSYWHKPDILKIQVNDYIDKGYRVLVVWDNDFNPQLEEVVRKFAME